MDNQNKQSRRDFLKASAITSVAMVSATMLSNCVRRTNNLHTNADEFPIFKGIDYKPTDGVAGLLFSQIGYELGFPVRIIIRLPKKGLLSENAICKLIPSGNEMKYETGCKYWGEIWGSHWWTVIFTGINESGEWAIEIVDNGENVFESHGLKVAENILWNSTVELSAADMLERRVHFTKVGAGWQDAGTLWVESPAQSAMVIGLEDLLEKGAERLDKELIERIYKQITVGCDYFVLLEKKATELGFPKGAQCHDLHGHEKDILPNDAVKTVIALLRASILLPESYSKKKKIYTETANATWEWLIKTAKPMGSYGMSLFQRGLPENTKIPDNEWQTRDLLQFCWAAFIKSQIQNDKAAKTQCIDFAQQVMARQILKEQNENGYYGHFYEFSSLKHSEKSWTHGIVGNEFGADMGQIYPNYLLPLVEMIRKWPEHEEAKKWHSCLENFVEGFLIPVCAKNPFLLVPQGIFGNEGPVWFCGTFHGTNAIYGYTAALAFEMAELLQKPELKDIAYSNLQWLVGLNAGITKDSLKACVIFSTDVPEGIALPASMMCGVGMRWAGTWFQTRGVICNGFSTGKQFVYDTEPKKANDGPFSLTDEDWIPHTASWLTGLVRMKS
jgi:hypothetical protein